MTVSLFENLLDESWILEKKDSYWIVREESKDTKNPVLEIGGCRSIAFSLDKVGCDAFPYIKNNTTLCGVRSVCDSLIVAEIENSGSHQSIFIALDLKSEKISNAPQQIHSGHLLFKYLINKMNYLKHTRIESIEGRFIGIVSCVGRKQARKSTTNRKNKKYEIIASSCGKYNIVKLIDEKKVNIVSLLGKIDFKFS